jgi:hypothetical protein
MANSSMCYGQLEFEITLKCYYDYTYHYRKFMRVIESDTMFYAGQNIPTDCR